MIRKLTLFAVCAFEEAALLFGFTLGLLWVMLRMDLDLFYSLATASVFLFFLSLLGKKLDKMVAQAKIAEKQRKVFWNLCAFSLMILWFGIFWEF